MCQRGSGNQFAGSASVRNCCSLDVANCYQSFIIGLMKPRGLYRERNGWGNQDSARVKYDEHQELDVSEDTYRARDYQPPFDELPWKDEPANDA
jgi:hypothetical protein